MPKEKIAVTIEKHLLERLDRLVSAGRYPSRSSAVERAVADSLERIDEGLAGDLAEWPEY